MLLRYIGPRAEVELPPYGRHRQGEIRDYPEDFALALVATSRRQRFEPVAQQKKTGGPGRQKKRGEKP